MFINTQSNGPYPAKPTHDILSGALNLVFFLLNWSYYFIRRDGSMILLFIFFSISIQWKQTSSKILLNNSSGYWVNIAIFLNNLVTWLITSFNGADYFLSFFFLSTNHLFLYKSKCSIFSFLISAASYEEKS